MSRWCIIRKNGCRCRLLATISNYSAVTRDCVYLQQKHIDRHDSLVGMVAIGFENLNRSRPAKDSLLSCDVVLRRSPKKTGTVVQTSSPVLGRWRVKSGGIIRRLASGRVAQAIHSVSESRRVQRGLVVVDTGGKIRRRLSHTVSVCGVIEAQKSICGFCPPQSRFGLKARIAGITTLRSDDVGGCCVAARSPKPAAGALPRCRVFGEEPPKTSKTSGRLG